MKNLILLLVFAVAAFGQSSYQQAPASLAGSGHLRPSIAERKAPTNTTGLSLWFEARADMVEITSGRVSKWFAQDPVTLASVPGTYLEQTNAAKRGVLQSARNGLSTLAMPTGDYMAGSIFPADTNPGWTILIAFENRSTPVSGGIANLVSETTQRRLYKGSGIIGFSGRNTGGVFISETSNLIAGESTGSPTWKLNELIVLAASYDKTTGGYILRKALSGRTVLRSTTSTVDNWTTTMELNALAGAESGDYNYFEILVYSRSLSEAESNAVINELYAKWL